MSKNSSFLAVVLLAVAGCSGSTQSSEGAPVDDAGTADASSTDGSNTDGSNTDGYNTDALTEDAGPCNAIGTWVLTTVPEAGLPESETIVIADAGSSGVTVSFEDRETPVDECSPPTDAGPAMGTSSETGSFDATSCVLVAEWTESYCASGEGQCLSLVYELTVSGDTAAGNLHKEGGWCMDTHSTDTPVTATRTQ